MVVATYGLAILGLAIGSLLLPSNPMIAAASAAVLCGWSEVDGLCGMSHVTTLTPLRVLYPHSGRWAQAVSAYTAGGLVTAALVGTLIGVLGAAEEGASELGCTEDPREAAAATQ